MAAVYRVRAPFCHNPRMTDSTITTDRHVAETRQQACRSRFAAGDVSLGTQALGFTGIELPEHRDHLSINGLAAGLPRRDGLDGSSHGEKRSHPASPVPGTLYGHHCTRMDYLPEGANPQSVLADGAQAYISRCAWGATTTSLVRGRLAKLANRIEAELGKGRYRAFVDGAYRYWSGRWRKTRG